MANEVTDSSYRARTFFWRAEMSYFQGYLLIALWHWIGGWTGRALLTLAILSLLSGFGLEWKGKKEQGDMAAKDTCR